MQIVHFSHVKEENIPHQMIRLATALPPLATVHNKNGNRNCSYECNLGYHQTCRQNGATLGEKMFYVVNFHLPYRERFFDLPMTNSSGCALSSFRSFDKTLHLQNCHSDHSTKHNISKIVIQIIRQNTTPLKSSFRSFDKTQHLQNRHSDHSTKHNTSKIVIQIIRQNTTRVFILGAVCPT